MRARLSRPFDRRTIREDATAGVVLGVESVPDGLAIGLLAGVNPLAGVYGYLYGTIGGALFTSTPFMAVQGTGAMALIVADADLAARPDPGRALFTLAVLAGLVMILAGVLGAGSLLRFVPTAVMVGFISAIGINIVLGQLPNFTGYDAAGENRVTQTLDLALHFWRVEFASVAVGAVTVVLIVVLQRTRLRAMGLVVAIVAGSGLAAILGRTGDGVPRVGDISDIPNSLPSITLPVLGDLAYLAVPAVSLAFVGLVQGAGVSAAYPKPDGTPSDTGRDFIGQGAGNIAAGLFQGMPVGGSMSASALVVAGGARTRMALVIAGGVMALIVLLLADVVGYVAMPALAGLLIVVGAGAVKPSQIRSVARTGPLQATVMAITLGLTMLIPLQYAVLVGVGLALVLFVVQQSNTVMMKGVRVDDDGRLREQDPPTHVGVNEVLVLQPYGSLFFASAPLFEAALPAVTPATRNSAVVIRLRGVNAIGLSIIDVLRRYANRLGEARCELVLVLSSERVVRQLELEGVTALIGAGNVYIGNEWLGETARRAHDDARRWVAGDPPAPPDG